VIEAIGEAVTSFKVGDEIYYSPQVFGEFGSYAQYHVAEESIFVFNSQYRSKLDALRNLIERYQIRPVIDSVLPISDIVQAHQRLEKGGMRGKIVLQLTN
jgi:NADPH:quinone reductase-like Zn-dependent oxidoreductase